MVAFVAIVSTSKVSDSSISPLNFIKFEENSIIFRIAGNSLLPSVIVILSPFKDQFTEGIGNTSVFISSSSVSV